MTRSLLGDDGAEDGDDVVADMFFEPPEDVEAEQPRPKSKKKKGLFRIEEMKSDDNASASEEEDSEGEGSEEETAGASESRHDRKQQRLNEQIAQLEAANVGDKPWQLGGGAVGLYACL